MIDGIVSSTQNTFEMPPPPVETPAKKEPGKFSRIFGAIAGGALNMIAPGAGSLIGNLIGGGGGGLQTDAYAMMAEQQKQQKEMLLIQNRMQNQTQHFTMITNLMKAKHDAEMSAVHNIKS